MISKMTSILVNGHLTRARLDGRDYESCAARAAARALNRRPSSVYSVRDDGYSESSGSFRRYYTVQVVTGRRNGDIRPVTNVRIAIDE